MRNITQPDNLNKYYMYKGYFVVRDRHDGTYSTYTSRGCLRASTQKAIKELINKEEASNDRKRI